MRRHVNVERDGALFPAIGRGDFEFARRENGLNSGQKSQVEELVFVAVGAHEKDAGEGVGDSECIISFTWDFAPLKSWENVIVVNGEKNQAARG